MKKILLACLLLAFVVSCHCESENFEQSFCESKDMKYKDDGYETQVSCVDENAEIHEYHCESIKSIMFVELMEELMDGVTK